MSDAPAVTVLTDADAVAGSLSVVRRAVLAELDEPKSATTIAEALGTSRQSVNYHLRALESAGLVEVDELRPRRGLNERVMRRTAAVVLIDPLVFDTAGLEHRDAAGLASVVATATDLIANAAATSVGAAQQQQRVAAATIDTEVRVESPEAFREMLAEIADVVARYDSPTGLRVRVACCALSSSTEPSSTEPSSTEPSSPEHP